MSTHAERIRRCVFPRSAAPLPCPLCGEVYTPQRPMAFLCPVCHTRLCNEGLSFRERIGRVVTAKIQALLGSA